MWRSLAMSFRIELAFHAANNEGSGGTNVMEPRRITVGDKEYDGISGEIIRRHILENFVKLCQQNNVPLHDRCKGLVPDRGKEPLRIWIQNNTSIQPVQRGNLQQIYLKPENYPEATKELIKECALCDVGGYLIAYEARIDKIERNSNSYPLNGVLKRDSCFEVGWLISEHPAIVDYTQHSAYDPDPERHNLFVQNMRVGIYGGVLRIDLDRIGRNDWWWLNPKSDSNPNGFEEYALKPSDRLKRACLLLEAIKKWLLSPTFAKQTGWLQHQSGLLEGSIVLSKDGAAPFVSPIKFEIKNGNPIIKKNENYRDILGNIVNKANGHYKKYDFNSPDELIEKIDEVLKELGCLDDDNQNETKD
ncbi:MAG: DevR family CRISPR-associated autoregulator [Archaeoglobales archaeon]|nr:MAG: DevR family CRISPR-associated autoregulator [Archaeoglobales archaeon]